MAACPETTTHRLSKPRWPLAAPARVRDQQRGRFGHHNDHFKLVDCLGSEIFDDAAQRTLWSHLVPSWQPAQSFRMFHARWDSVCSAQINLGAGAVHLCRCPSRTVGKPAAVHLKV